MKGGTSTHSSQNLHILVTLLVTVIKCLTKKQFKGRRDYFGLQFVGTLSLQLGRDADGKLPHSRKVK